MEEAPSRLPSHHPEPEAFMRCFQPPADTRFYAGVDLHARSLFLVVLDCAGQARSGRNLPAQPAPSLRAVQPFRGGLVVGCECMHCWYWLADTCREANIAFVLGHAWAMKAVHGSKTKCDRHDAQAIARLLRGGNFPLAYAYPKERRGLRAVLSAQKDERIGALLQRLASRLGKAKALSALAHKLGRAFYHMLHTKEVFDVNRFVRP